MNQTPPRGCVNDLRRMLRWIAFMCRAMAFSAEVFLHTGFGSKYIGVQAAAVPTFMLVYALFWTGHNLIPLFAFLAAYVGMCVAALVDARSDQERRDRPPDHYSGFPRNMRNFVFLNECWNKCILEPVYVFVLGWLTTIFDEPLGVYLMIISAALFVSVNVTALFARTPVRESVQHSRKPRPLFVQVRRVPSDATDRIDSLSSNPTYGERS